MALADTANLLVKLNMGGNFTSQIGKATTGLGKFSGAAARASKAGQQIGTGIKRGAAIAAVGIGFLVSQIGLGLNSLIKLEQAQAQTNAVVKSTGAIAGISGAEVGRLAEKYEALNALIGDEVIRSGENMLLTFTNIRKEAFEPALLATLNLNTALGKGPEGLVNTAILVGKALNDPIKGIGALKRVGVSLTETQIKQIKQFVKQNDLLSAQKVILGELDTEYKGSFLAQGGTTAGKVAKFTDSIEDLQRALAEALLPALGNVADALSKMLGDEKVKASIRDFGKSLAGFISPANLAEAGRILGDVFGAARDAAPVIASAASAIAGFVGAAVGAFRSLPPEIQKLAVGAFVVNKLTGGLVTNLAGGLISSVLKQLVSGVVNVQGAVVNVAGGIPGALPAAAGAGGVGIGTLTAAGALLVAPIALAIARQMSGDPNVVGGSRGFFPGQGPTPEMIGFRSDLVKALADAEIFGPPRPLAHGQTRGASLGDRDEAGSAIRAGILQRAVAAGFHPSAAAIERTLKKNDQHLLDIKNAVLGLNRAGGIMFKGGGRPEKDDKVVVNVPIRDVNTAGDIRRRFGKTPTQSGAR